MVDGVHPLIGLLMCHALLEPLGATDPRDRIYALLGMVTDNAAKKIVPITVCRVKMRT
jgi:hypothetical protein